MKRLVYTAFLTVMLISCGKSPDSIRKELNISAAGRGFVEKEYDTANFNIYSLQKITDKSQPLNIYIEGDGKAWLSRTRLSPNPTPHNLLLANIALKDNAPNVIYLARPCQFVGYDVNCSSDYWSVDRFSKPVIDSYKQVLRGFKNEQINLVGYSGGAAVAILLAADMDNVRSITTIAGNIDYNAFTRYHKVDSLNDEMDIDSAIRKVSAIPQTHYMGGEDKVVTSYVFDSFKNKTKDYEQNSSHIKFIEVPGATHGAGWEGLRI